MSANSLTSDVISNLVRCKMANLICRSLSVIVFSLLCSCGGGGGSTEIGATPQPIRQSAQPFSVVASVEYINDSTSKISFWTKDGVLLASHEVCSFLKGLDIAPDGYIRVKCVRGEGDVSRMLEFNPAALAQKPIELSDFTLTKKSYAGVYAVSKLGYQLLSTSALTGGRQQDSVYVIPPVSSSTQVPTEQLKLPLGYGVDSIEFSLDGAKAYVVAGTPEGAAINEIDLVRSRNRVVVQENRLIRGLCVTENDLIYNVFSFSNPEDLIVADRLSGITKRSFNFPASAGYVGVAVGQPLVTESSIIIASSQAMAVISRSDYSYTEFSFPYLPTGLPYPNDQTILQNYQQFVDGDKVWVFRQASNFRDQYSFAIVKINELGNLLVPAKAVSLQGPALLKLLTFPR